MNLIEGCYIVALASVFALIPSGPGYAGTQDAAAITGILALGGTESQAVTYLILVRFVIAVPITVAGLGLLAARYGGLRSCCAARDEAPLLEVAGYVALVAAALAVRLIGLDDRPFHHDESQDAYFSWLFFTEGEYQYQPILHGPLRFYLTSAVYLLFGDSDFTARLAPALMGALMVPLPYLLRDQLGRVGRVRRGGRARVRAVLPVLQPLRARGHLHRLHHAGAAGRHVPLPRAPAPPPAGADRRAARAQLRDQGVDVHHRLRRRHVLPRRARAARRGATACATRRWCAPSRRSAGRRGSGRSPRSRSSSRCSSPSSSPTRPGSGTASTTGSTTGSPSTGPAAARRSGTSTSSSCSRRSGRRCCSARSARSRRSAGRRCCARS